MLGISTGIDWTHSFSWPSLLFLEALEMKLLLYTLCYTLRCVE